MKAILITSILLLLISCGDEVVNQYANETKTTKENSAQNDTQKSLKTFSFPFDVSLKAFNWHNSWLIAQNENKGCRIFFKMSNYDRKIKKRDVFKVSTHKLSTLASNKNTFDFEIEFLDNSLGVKSLKCENIGEMDKFHNRDFFEAVHLYLMEFGVFRE